MKFHLIFFLAVAAGVALDLWSKSASFSRIAPGTFIEVVPGVLHLTPAANTGAAFSLLSGKVLLISAVALLAIGLLLWMYAKSWRDGPPLLLTAIGMILCGAIGNLHDRIAYGHVRDFIDFVPALPLVGHWPVFNVADICVTVGVGLYLLWEFALRPREAAGAETKHA